MLGFFLLVLVCVLVQKRLIKVRLGLFLLLLGYILLLNK